ncbi:MAG: YihY/virulence factor BrkB family protein [Pseudomonadota bacterium]|uniref:YihY/virulence factor BrkB family protein n=1 Tax=Thermithiobacillus tepidarius TaxID=929 RepID=UPI00040F877D|nr:YihY/virulence factor BrkB family protein [Thermithiobacillus tepidarius]
MAPASERSKQAHDPWKLGGLSVVELGKRVWKNYNEHNVPVWATFLAFSFLLSLFPMFIVFASLGAYLDITPAQVLDLLARFAPPEAVQLLRGTVHEVLGNRNPGLISFGILLSLWAASRGIMAIMRALNHAYEIEEDRNFFMQRATALFLLLTAGAILLFNLLLITVGPVIGDWLNQHIPPGSLWELVWNVSRWLAQFILALLMVALIYYFAPAADNDWKWITPGSLVAVILWIIVSIGFSLYVQNFGHYSTAYGSLGAAIVLMLWLQLTGMVILIGGEINAQIDKAADAAREKDKTSEDRTSE